MYECPWLAVARKCIGQKEIYGPRHNSWIVHIWETLKLPFRDDETAWCAGFVGYCLETVGIKSTRSAAARSYQNFGTKIDRPIPGCIVVFWRGSPNGYNGHVGFVTGQTRSGNLVVLGGNQSDMVCERAFEKDRVLSYRWPLGVPVPKEAVMKEEVKEPAKSGWIKIPVSTNEA